MDINIEKFSSICFTIAITETLCFWHPVLSCRLWTFWYYFSETHVPWINHGIAFYKFISTLEIIKNYNHYLCYYYYYYYHYYCHFHYHFHIVYYRWINWITWNYTHCILPLPFYCKSSYGKTKIISVDPPLKTHKPTHTPALSFVNDFIVVIFKLA